MNVTSERQDDVLWLCVSGRINIVNAAQFEQTVKNAI